jgi:hypothetical protein
VEQLHRQIIDLQRKWRDHLDDPNNSGARQVDSAIQRLEDDIQTNKNPRSIEDQVKRLLQQLNSLENTSVMDNSHLNDLQRSFESMRDSLRKLM